MNNVGFTQIDEATKISNLTDVLYKRCRGFLKPDVVRSVVCRLDYNKQMNITNANEEAIRTQAKLKTKISITDGNVSGVDIQWGKCLLGRVEFGKELVTVENGSETIHENTDTVIVDAPLIIQLEEQELGSLDSKTTKILIYL